MKTKQEKSDAQTLNKKPNWKKIAAKTGEILLMGPLLLLPTDRPGQTERGENKTSSSNAS